MRFLLLVSFFIAWSVVFGQAQKVSGSTAEFHFLFDPGKNWRAVGYKEWKSAAPIAMRSWQEDSMVGKMMLLVPASNKNIADPPTIFIQAAQTPIGIFSGDSLKKMADIIWTQNPYLDLHKGNLDPQDSLGLTFLNSLRESKPYYDPEHKCIITRVNYADESKKRFDMLLYQYFGDGWMVTIRFITDGETHAKINEFVAMIKSAQFEKEYRLR